MTPGVVSEDLFRQLIQVNGQLAGAVADSGRTLPSTASRISWWRPRIGRCR